MSKVIVVVDMQNDFVDGSLGTAEAQAMLPRLVKKLSEARAGSAADFVFTKSGVKPLDSSMGI